MILIGTLSLATIPIEEVISQTIPGTGEVPLDQKIGQMLLLGFAGTCIAESDPIARDIREGRIGGVVLSESNIETGPDGTPREQIKALTASLQRLSPVPLFIAVDYEGGRVSRFKPEHGFPGTRSAHALGRKNDLRETRTQASKMAGLLTELGINVNLAPVVDLALNPDNPVIVRRNRSYSSDPMIVSDHARAFIQEHHRKGILCAVKHFPGHGSSAGDTHHGGADITRTWKPEELIPYRLLIREGLPDFVMTAHVSHRRIDAANPATLSRSALTTILRGQLRYGGVIITDDMHMGAVVGAYGIETAVIQAVTAGVDILLFTHNPGAGEHFAQRLIRILSRAVENGRLTPERIDASYRKIMAIKQKIQT